MCVRKGMKDINLTTCTINEGPGRLYPDVHVESMSAMEVNGELVSCTVDKYCLFLHICYTVVVVKQTHILF